MLRRLTNKEVDSFVRNTSRSAGLSMIREFGEMSVFWSIPLRDVPYLQVIQRFINQSEEFHESYCRREFAENLWISDGKTDLPKLTRCGVSGKELDLFVASIMDEDSDFAWPKDLDAKSIANYHVFPQSENWSIQWAKNRFDDVSELKQVVAEEFTYMIEVLPKENKKTKTRNEEKKMMNIFGEDMGAIDGMGMSIMDGSMAIPGEDGKFFTFNSKSKEITDVTDVMIEMDLPAYAMPVNPETIVAGDIVRHNGQFLFVSSVTKAGKITGTKPDTAEEVTIVPIKNALFGQSFIAKVTTINMFAGTPGAEGETAKGPFGDMNPMMLMMMMKKDDGGGSNMSKMMLPMMLQQGGLGAGADGQMNPMMMMMLMDKMN